MPEKLTHSELCDLLASLMEYRVLIETGPIETPAAPTRLWKHIITYVDRAARENDTSRLDMLAHLVYLGLAVEASTPETVSHIIEKLR